MLSFSYILSPSFTLGLQAVRPPRHKALVDKAVSACLAGIEVYNKPSFPHREEVFAILMINAWELLLKARIMKENGNKLTSIYEYGPGKTKTGKSSKARRIRRSASGNPRTIGLAIAIKVTKNLPKDRLPEVAADNIEAMQEIRDSAVRFLNTDPALSERVWQVGTGSLRNFLTAASAWFDHDLSQHSLFLMPLAFVQPPEVEAVPVSRQREIEKLEVFLDTLDKKNAAIGADQPYIMGLRLDLKLVGSKHAGAATIRLTTDPSAPVIRLAEEDIRARYPLTHRKLIEMLQARYSDFLANKKFNNLKKEFQSDPRYALMRKLDPENPKTQKMFMYSPKVLDAFDKHYTRAGNPTAATVAVAPPPSPPKAAA